MTTPAKTPQNASTGPAPEGTAWKDKPYLKYYAEWTPHSLEYTNDSLLDMLDRSVANNQDATMMDFFGATTTYGNFGKQVNSAAAGLRELGVRKGDRVALIMPNCPQALIAFFAILRLGGVVAMHNPLYTARELEGPFRDHGADIVIAWDKVAPVCQQLVEKNSAQQNRDG